MKNIFEWQYCLPYEQAVTYTNAAAGQATTKILLTVQGEENYKKAPGYFGLKNSPVPF